MRIKGLEVVTRKFTGGAGLDKPIDQKKFEDDMAAYRHVLRLPKVSAITVAVPTEFGNKYSEIPDADGNTPTMKAILEAFPNGEVKPVAINDWGKNAGSGRALSQVALNLPSSVSHIFFYSPEINVKDEVWGHGIEQIEAHDLDVLGFLRERYDEKLQWRVPQHTAAIVKRAALEAVGGIDLKVDGTGRTIKLVIPSFGEEAIEVDVAGMDDWDTQLKMLLANPNGFRWGMVGRKNPLPWTTKFSDPKRQADQDKKEARQGAVMEIYGKDRLPDLTFDQVLERFKEREVPNEY